MYYYELENIVNHFMIKVDLDLGQRFDPFLIATDNTSIFINNCQIVLSFIYFD